MEIIIHLFLPLSLAIIMFSLGIGLTLNDFKRVFIMPRAIIIGLIGQMVLLPFIAFALLHVVQLPAELALGLMILSLAPGGVTSNVLTRLAGGTVALSVSMTAISSLLCILVLPLVVSASAGYFLQENTPPINVTKIGVAMAIITAAPVAFGVLLNELRPYHMAKIRKPVSVLAIVLFLVIVAGAIATNLHIVLPNIARLAPILIGLNVILLFLGQITARLAKLSQNDSVAIALEIGIQNATLGITVGVLIAAGSQAIPDYALPSAIYALTMYLCGFGFIGWTKYWQRKTNP